MKQNFKKQEVDFTQVKNAILENKELSLKAKGLFAYLYSKPDGWDFSHKRIALEMKESSNTIAKILKELEKNGYLKRKRLHTGRMNYFIMYEPHTKKATYQKSQRGKVGTVSNIEVSSNTKLSKDSSKSYGREDINQSIEFLKEKNNGMIDGTIKENRQYATLLINKIKKAYPGKDTVNQIKVIIQTALQDEFHSKNATSMKYLYYNTQKIIQTVRSKQNRVVEI